MHFSAVIWHRCDRPFLAQCRSAALAASRQLSHQETGHPRLWMMARVTNEKDGYRE
jgi:hypothetical protein